MNRSARRILLRLVLLASPLVVLTLVATCLLSHVDFIQPPANGLTSLLEVQQQDRNPCGILSETVPPPQAPHEDLQRQLQQLKQVISQLEDRLRHRSLADGIPAGLTGIDVINDNKNVACSSSYIQKQIEQSEMEKGKKWHNEYEVVPHSFFTLSAFYSTEAGMGRRVVERPIGSRRQDLQEAVSSALSILNRRGASSGNKRYVASDFVEGLYRIDPIEGTQYELWFQTTTSSSSSSIDNHSSKEPDLVRVALLRPHAPLVAVRLEPKSQEIPPIVNIIVPLSGRLSAFELFLNRFRKNVLTPAASTSRLHLTVVFFGDRHWDEIQREMLAFEKAAGFSNFHLLNINTTFSRARGLQVGVEHWENSPIDQDILVFLCDVDVSFDSAFIDRCRRNAQPKRQAYFPIVFSQYNPNVTKRFSHHDSSVPVLHKDAGFWRDFGFGMVCTYRSDFMSLGGFHGGDDTTGWGGEDLFLYRKYIRSPLRVIRAPDKNLFHLWHPKQCPTTLGPVQRRACLQSRGRNEASYDQLALLLFSDGQTHHVPEPDI